MLILNAFLSILTPYAHAAGVIEAVSGSQTGVQQYDGPTVRLRLTAESAVYPLPHAPPEILPAGSIIEVPVSSDFFRKNPSLRSIAPVLRSSPMAQLSPPGERSRPAKQVFVRHGLNLEKAVIDLESLVRGGKVRLDAAALREQRNRQCDDCNIHRPPQHLPPSMGEILQQASAGQPSGQATPPREPTRPTRRGPPAIGTSGHHTNPTAPCEEQFPDTNSIYYRVCKSYSQNPSVQRMNQIIKSRAVHNWYYGYCKLFVRRALNDARLFQNGRQIIYPGLSSPALDAAYMTDGRNNPTGQPGQLEQRGFINLMDPKYGYQIRSPADAPPGALVVYRTEAHTMGHIEVRTDENGRRRFASSFSNQNSFTHDGLTGVYRDPRTGREYKKEVVGVFVNLNLDQ